jgi:integrase/recombinase XerD
MVLPTVMSMDEVSKIFRAVYGELDNFPKETYLYKEKVRDVAVIELLFGTGVRVFELCSLTKDIVENHFSFIKVYGKGRKERTIQIENEEIKSALKNYYLLFKKDIEKGEFFFVNRLGSRLSEQSVRLMIRKYRLKCKITKNITPHIFRHSFATLLLEKDVDIKYIQTILGHSSIVTTQIYTHVSSEKQTAILHDKHPRNEMNFG